MSTPTSFSGELRMGLSGAAALSLLRRDGMARIATTPRAAWRSLAALVLSIPLILLRAQLVPEVEQMGPPVTAPPLVVLLHVILYVAIYWLGFACLLEVITRWSMGRRDVFAPLLAVYDWVSLLWHGLLTAGVALLRVMALEGDLVLGLVTLGEILRLVCLWFGLRAALGGKGVQAFGLVALEFMTISMAVLLVLNPLLEAGGD